MLLAAHLALVGCTASWRAPVETRGAQPPSKTRSTTTTRPLSHRTRPPARPTIRADAYRVRAGDTLYGIAWQRGVDHLSIARWNGLRPPYRIYAGQTLRLKPPAHKRMPPAPPVAKPRPRTKPTSPPRSAKPPVRSKQLTWIWPAKGRLVSRFKPGDQLRSGIKIAGYTGQKIRAAEGGKVVYSGSGLIGYGRLIIVKHNDKYLSAYGHNRKLLVAEGDQVTKGQKIAEMGTADNGDPVLHFEIRRGGKPVDPIGRLPRR